MSLLFFDGFDHLTTTAQLGLKYDDPALTSCETLGRDGGGALRCHGQKATKLLSTSSDTAIVGLAINSPSNTEFLYMYNGTNFISIATSGTSAVTMVSVAGTISSSEGILAKDLYNYVELKTVYHETTGSIEVKVNGEVIFNETGLNTINSDEVSCSKVMFGASAYIINHVDDLYICDGEGTTNNDFLGDVRVKTLYADADGSFSDFTPLTPGDHYPMVNSTTFDDTTYVSSNNVGDKELFSMDPAISSEEIFGLQVTTANEKLSGGTITTRSLMVSGGTPTETEGETIYGAPYTKGDCRIFEKEPIDDVPWTSTIIDSCEFGIKVHSYS